jgi:DNA-binding LytR/AlgR family response regulator
MVVDDEPLAIDVVVDYLQKWDIHPVCYENGIEALRQLRGEDFDLLFLDIEMPGLNGISLLKSLSHRPAVVLTTAYRDYAVEGFDLEVLDYLVKPFSFSRMQQTMDKFVRWRDTVVSPQEALFLKVDKQLIQVQTKDILYLESKKDYVRVYAIGHEYLCHLTLTDITAKLPPEKFFRLHRSYTVALDKISLLKDNWVHIGGRTLPVSRELRMELKRRLQW